MNIYKWLWSRIGGQKGCAFKGDRLKKVIGLFMNLLVTILAVDLLYLYYACGWYDPIKWIEITEVALLYLFAVAGIVGAVLKLKEYMK